MFYEVSEESLQTGEHPYDPVWIFKENCVHSKGLVAKDFSHVPRQKNRRCPLKQTSIRSTGTPRVSTYCTPIEAGAITPTIQAMQAPGFEQSWAWNRMNNHVRAAFNLNGFETLHSFKSEQNLYIQTCAPELENPAGCMVKYVPLGILKKKWPHCSVDLRKHYSARSSQTSLEKNLMPVSALLRLTKET